MKLSSPLVSYYKVILFIILNEILILIIVDVPAMPNITNVTASSTSITITWDQNTTSDVIWYEIRYNFIIRGCEIQSDNYTIDMIEGSHRNYTLENSTTTPVEEYSAYTIFLSANNFDGASDTSIMEVLTQQSSEFKLLYTTHIVLYYKFLCHEYISSSKWSTTESPY